MSTSKSHASGSRGRRKATQKPSSKDTAGSKNPTTRSVATSQEPNRVNVTGKEMLRWAPTGRFFGTIVTTRGTPT